MTAQLLPAAGRTKFPVALLWPTWVWRLGDRVHGQYSTVTRTKIVHFYYSNPSQAKSTETTKQKLTQWTVHSSPWDVRTRNALLPPTLSSHYPRHSTFPASYENLVLVLQHLRDHWALGCDGERCQPRFGRTWLKTNFAFRILRHWQGAITVSTPEKFCVRTRIGR